MGRRPSKVKNVYFYEEDAELLEYANNLPNFSKLMKKFLQKEREEGWLIDNLRAGKTTVLSQDSTVVAPTIKKKNDVKPPPPVTTEGFLI